MPKHTTRTDDTPAEPPSVDQRLRALLWTWATLTAAIAAASLLAGWSGARLGWL